MKAAISGMSNAIFKKKVGMGTVANVGLTAAGGVMSYNDARAEGKGVAASAAEATFITAAFSMIGIKPALVLGAGYLGYQGVKAGVQTGMENSKIYGRAGTASPFSQGTFVDTEQSYTMRQAGMTMMQQNAMNTKKAVMGNEAMYMHR